MNPGAHRIELLGETLWLHPDRALLWPAQSALLVADTHFGKSHIFRQQGLAIPAGTDAHDRERLRVLLEESGASHLWVLGDFLHGPLAADAPEVRAMTDWLRKLPGVELGVIAGNHDRDVLKHWQPPFAWHSGTLRIGPLSLLHDAALADPSSRGGTISGHIHPVWRVKHGAMRRTRLPVFWKNAVGLVLPSFGSLTGGYSVTPADGDELFAVAGDSVLPVPKGIFESRIVC